MATIEPVKPARAPKDMASLFATKRRHLALPSVTQTRLDAHAMALRLAEEDIQATLVNIRPFIAHHPWGRFHAANIRRSCAAINNARDEIEVAARETMTPIPKNAVWWRALVLAAGINLTILTAWQLLPNSPTAISVPPPVAHPTLLRQGSAPANGPPAANDAPRSDIRSVGRE